MKIVKLDNYPGQVGDFIFLEDPKIGVCRIYEIVAKTHKDYSVQLARPPIGAKIWHQSKNGWHALVSA